IMIVPMILLIPFLTLDKVMNLLDIIPQLLISFGIIVLVFISAKFLIPRILFTLVNLKMRDVFLIGIIVISLGTAWLTYSIGFSFAIGAFLAGLILSETEYTHQITSDVYPFKDIFTSLFFVSFGMLLDISFVLNNPITVISYTFLIIALKLSVVFLIIYLLKYPVRISAMVAISLAQIGEFSFVLASIGMDYDLLSQDLYKGFIAASLITLLFTPVLISFAPRLTSKLPELSKRKRLTSSLTPKDGLQNHVIIVGYGLNGHNLAKVLKETGINYVVIELNPKTFKTASANNEKIIFGDASKLKILESANIDKAKMIVFAISDPIAIRRCIQSARQLNPNIHIIVRTRYVSEIDDLLSLGANEVIPEEFETSIQIFSRVLKKYHIPNSVILAQSNIIRNQSYGILRDVRFSDLAFEQINQILAQGTIDTVFIGHNNVNIGKSLKEINLKALTGATVITVIRNNESIHNPSGSFIIQENDQLILFGTHEAIDNADELLISEA
ncbi:MAG: cation:proton antiporter, partial [Ignavibacteria bacterium]|nr:cation:proton antiporter [Ignavibacteria bacterium]